MFKQKLGIISVLGTTLPLLLFTTNSAHSANLIQNGSFETGPNPGSFITLPTGSTAINNWTVTGGNIDYKGSYWTASDGQRSIDLNGEVAGAIAQTFNTTIGESYLVTFDLAGNPEFLPIIKNMTVEAAGQSEDFSFDTTGKTFSDMGWIPQSWQFTANNNQTTLEFASLTNGSASGPTLDNVAVVPADTPVPEPGTIIGSLTLLGLGTLSRRKKTH
jgi:choice-of-anchor C domain-containing protein